MLGGVVNKSCNINSILEEGGNHLQNSIDNSQEAFLISRPRTNTVLA